jgi:signal-transduction protein with cAMP-binding, CBS, and nucleotidyltransferase domain
MPTNYKSADFSQLYSQYQRDGGIDDLKRLKSVIDLGSDCSFFVNLDAHLESLDSGCRVLNERLSYLKVRRAEVDKLVARIDLTSALDELQELHRRLNVIAIELYLKGVGVMEIHALITDYRHILTQRVVAIMSARFAPQPCAFAWFNMGSDGRREQTFFTDQDNALVYEVDGDPEIDAYFESFAKETVTALDRVGFALCSGNIMPSNPDWRGSLEGWRQKMENIFHDQSRNNLLRVIILMDIVFCAGSVAISQLMIEKLHQMIQDNFGALMVMARSAVMSSVALTMFKKFRLEKDSEHQGKFNVKLFGWAPLIMTTRVFALKYGFTETNTVARIRHLESQHHFDAEFSQSLQKAYQVLANAKMVSQVEAIVSRQDYDYYLDPETLKEDDQEELRLALSSVESLQKLAYNSFFSGI